MCANRYKPRCTVALAGPKLNLITVAQVDEFWDANVEPNDWVIGVHYRGTDKKTINYPFKSPPMRLFQYYILEAARVRPSMLSCSALMAWRLSIARDINLQAHDYVYL